MFLFYYFYLFIFVRVGGLFCLYWRGQLKIMTGKRRDDMTQKPLNLSHAYGLSQEKR